MLEKADIESIFKTTQSLNLPTGHTYFYDPNILMEALNDTIKHRNGDQNLPVPKSIGSYVFINDLSYDEIKQASQLMLDFNKQLANS